jgi:hypothetical protein
MVPRFWICVHADQLLGERDHAIEQPTFENSQFQIDARPEDAGEMDDETLVPFGIIGISVREIDEGQI